MDILTIISAKYLFVVSPLIVFWLYVKEEDRRKDFLIRAAGILPLSYLLAVIARKLYYNPRPFVLEGFSPLVKHIPDNGFPSDHTLLLAALAATAASLDCKWSAVLWLITIVVGGSRVLAGVHHATDILGSIAIALVAKWVVSFVLKRRQKV